MSVRTDVQSVVYTVVYGSILPGMGLSTAQYSTTLHTGSPLMNVAYMKYCTRSPASGKDSVITQYVARITTSTDRLRIAVLEDSTHVGMEHMYSYDICTSFLSEGKQ